jgi:hypothetical protein
MEELTSDHLKTIYCNGLANTYADAVASAKAISTLLGRPVECCYNNALNDLLFGMAFFTFLPLHCVGMGLQSRSVVEKRKALCALALAQKIRLFLQEHPLNRIVLIVHSQGRDIGNVALKFLEHGEKKRISVVTLGSSPIAAQAAGKVINLQQRGDPIPRLMHLRDTVKNVVHLNFSPLEKEVYRIEGYGHYLASYLELAPVQETLHTTIG